MAKGESYKTSSKYQFTTKWFDRFEDIWIDIFARHRPSRVLEIGSYEGRSACFVIERVTKEQSLHLTCVDTWEGGAEHIEAGVEMSEVESRFDHNTQLAIDNAANAVELVKMKSRSDDALVQLLAERGKGTFDLIFVDGSHTAPDVLLDAVLSFQLLKIGGILIFDDYLWSMESIEERDLLNMPKLAIDSFVNINQRKVQILPARNGQQYLKKVYD